MTESEITVKKLSHYVPVSLTDAGEQGRQHYMCPYCHDDTAHFDDNGQGHCPSCDAVAEFVRKSVEDAGGVRDIWREYWSRRARLRRMHHLYRQRRR